MTQQKKEADLYMLYPGATVFISTVETINLPNDVVGFVVPQNTLVRSGLQVEAPVYQPGHKTRMFLRVTNVSADAFTLKSGNKIAAIMFVQTNEPVAEYSGMYVDEFDYRGVAEYPKDTLPQVVKVEEKINEIKELEDKILNKVITIITIFVSLFTLINTNINFVEDRTLLDMLVYNIMTVGIIGFLIGFVSVLTKKIEKESIKTVIIISTILLAVALLVAKCTSATIV